MRRSVITLFAGLAVAISLIWVIGFESIYLSIAAAGFGGLGLLCCYALVPLVLSATAWSRLLPIEQRIRFSHFFVARLIGDSIADLPLYLAVGGMAATARAMIQRQMLPAYAAASVAVDATTQAMGQVAFLVLGTVLGLIRFYQVADAALMEDAIVAALLFAMLIVLQKRDGNFIRRVASYLFSTIEIDASFRGAIYELYASHERMALSAALHLVAWIATGIGTFMAFRLMGGSISVWDAIALESLNCTICSLAAFVPAAVGVQEAGYAVLALIFGLPVELGVAVSLLKRAREIVIGAPTLLYWRTQENKSAFVGRRRQRS